MRLLFHRDRHHLLTRCGIVEPGKVPGAGLHHQLGMLEVTGILGGVPRRQPDVVLGSSTLSGQAAS
jgi:hypothetical protein